MGDPQFDGGLARSVGGVTAFGVIVGVDHPGSVASPCLPDDGARRVPVLLPPLDPFLWAGCEFCLSSPRVIGGPPAGRIAAPTPPCWAIW